MEDIIEKLVDRTDLVWSKTRRSSGTAGSFLKAEEIVDGKKIYYKLSNYEMGKGVIGHECINEIIADRLLTLFDIEHLHYKLIHMTISMNGENTDTWVCASEDFKKLGDSKLAMDTYYELEAEKCESPLEFCVRKGLEEYIYEMLAVDYLILNRDRHGANIEMIKNKYDRTLRPAPLFDHGLSMILENDAAVEDYDISQAKKVQCFVGGSNPEDNIRLVPRDRLPKFRPFTENDKAFLFAGLENAISTAFFEKTWEFLNYRRGLYENICNKK